MTGEDGGIDRATLRTRVTGNDEAMKKLESIVHPIVGAMQRAITALKLPPRSDESIRELIGLGRLSARPIATMTLEAQEKHERREKVHRDE